MAEPIDPATDGSAEVTNDTVVIERPRRRWGVRIAKTLAALVIGLVVLVVAIVLAAVVYLGSLFLFPEPRYVFGPQGPRWVPSKPGEAPPITDPVRPAGAEVAS